jgi:hypothetical protein
LTEYDRLGIDAAENLQQSLSHTSGPIRSPDSFGFRAAVRDAVMQKPARDPRDVITQAVNECAPPGGWLPPPEMQARMQRRAGEFFGETTRPGGARARDAAGLAMPGPATPKPKTPAPATPKPKTPEPTTPKPAGSSIAKPLRSAASGIVGRSRRQAGQVPGTAEASARTVYAGHLDRVIALLRPAQRKV